MKELTFVDHAISGNGALVLTRHVLWFTMLSCDITVNIPLTSITKLTATNSINRTRLYEKTRGKHFLCVEYTNANGDEDEAVFYVADAEAWKGWVESAMRGGGWIMEK